MIYCRSASFATSFRCRHDDAGEAVVRTRRAHAGPRPSGTPVVLILLDVPGYRSRRLEWRDDGSPDSVHSGFPYAVPINPEISWRNQRRRGKEVGERKQSLWSRPIRDYASNQAIVMWFLGRCACKIRMNGRLCGSSDLGVPFRHVNPSSPSGQPSRRFCCVRKLE